MPTLPMLSGEGWVSDPSVQMSRLFTHMFLTDYSQSNIYAGEVTSLQYLLLTNDISSTADRSGISQLKEAVETQVKTYYGRYFDNVEVQFTPINLEEDTSEVIFEIEISGVHNGQMYDLKRTVKTDGSEGTQRFIMAFEGGGQL